MVKTEDNKRGENLSRSVVTQMGGQAQISFCPMSGVDVKRTCVKNTLSLALDIGLSSSGVTTASFNVVFIYSRKLF
ncbi:S-methyl thiohydantoin desulfurase domain-containing protein [Endozoicomonas euniceicola]|uniref:S-methyl thiohydantoin desulfurase domain-containing protein n=1 Tax=Endozoicomonas euniceicola TaxID=1234143 RepID=UPI00384E3012